MPVFTDTNSINYTYTVGNSDATVTSSPNATGAITILASFIVNSVTYNVTSIGMFAFQSNTKITSVTIPSSVTSIGQNAFGDCTSLSSNLTIPSSVTSIGMYAFGSCRITSVTIPSSVTLAAGAFANCVRLKTIGQGSNFDINIIGNSETITYRVIMSQNNNVILNAILNVYKNLNIINYFYNSNNIGTNNLTRGDNVNFTDYCDYMFINQNFTYNGTAILTIPALDSQYGANKWFTWNNGTSTFLSYRQFNGNWVNLPNPFVTNVTSYVSVADSLASGKTIAELLATGVSVEELSAGGVSVEELSAGGVSLEDIHQPAPVITNITATSTTASISFTQSTKPGLLAITKYAYSTDGTNYTDLSSAQTTSPLQISGLTIGQTYSFRIKAYNGLYSEASDSVSVVTNPPQPAPVITNVSYSSGLTKVYFTQGTNQYSSSITKYSYSVDNGLTYSETNVTTSPLHITGLKPRVENRIIIKAYNGLDSDPSNTYSFTYYMKVGKTPQ